MPPRGWWELFPLGVTAFMLALAGRPLRERLWLGALAGVVHYGIALRWLTDFTGGGYLAVVVLETALLVLVAAVSFGGPTRAGAVTRRPGRRGWWLTTPRRARAAGGGAEPLPLRRVPAPVSGLQPGRRAVPGRGPCRWFPVGDRTRGVDRSRGGCSRPRVETDPRCRCDQCLGGARRATGAAGHPRDRGSGHARRGARPRRRCTGGARDPVGGCHGRAPASRPRHHRITGPGAHAGEYRPRRRSDRPDIRGCTLRRPGPTARDQPRRRDHRSRRAGPLPQRVRPVGPGGEPAGSLREAPPRPLRRVPADAGSGRATQRPDPTGAARCHRRPGPRSAPTAWDTTVGHRHLLRDVLPRPGRRGGACRRTAGPRSHERLVLYRPDRPRHRSRRVPPARPGVRSRCLAGRTHGVLGHHPTRRCADRSQWSGDARADEGQRPVADRVDSLCAHGRHPDARARTTRSHRTGGRPRHPSALRLTGGPSSTCMGGCGGPAIVEPPSVPRNVDGRGVRPTAAQDRGGVTETCVRVTRS
ncbi:putative Apolipoprotein N-acyltransferase [Janibacter hoylei PVAS-1]|uniref:Putative Apolipoprotein N-acyltransferase n=1 Tax=Janibacter hoylei PVAS-1 TaxID=1210046 RepID=K1DUN3_9MICO|nr:putative Apolipoprotein N-acyltransferase [Janibacter hoylei PVAS-1]